MRPPEGVIALLFTDIEGSTTLARRLGDGWAAALAAQRAVVGDAIAAHGGYVDGIEGDAFFATFGDPAAAARAAVAAQRGLAADLPDVRVRMGLHVGRVDRAATGYVGLEVHRAARVAGAAHGGQVILTRAAAALAGDAVALEPLGAHRLKDFPEPEQLFCAVVDGRGAADFPPPRTAEVRPTNLPALTTTLIGRDADVRRVQEALAGGERLVTLTGRGGAGKTSLARVAAESGLDAHPGGVWWVALATVTTPDAVLAAVATAVGAQQAPDRPAAEAVAAHLRDHGPTLLVLDNLEQAPQAAADVAALVEALPDLRVLATSQAPLRVPAERVLPVDTLAEPDALALVRRAAERAGAVLPGDDDALREVVRLLDGLPLGLELAAARLKVLTPAQLRDRLEGSFDVLRDRAPGRPERHRSLRATIDWTLDLLEPEPLELFTRLGAFAGPAELEELEAVAGADGLDVLDALAALLDVALVRRVESGDGRVRFGLPEALRQVAAERLDAAGDGHRWRLAHAERQLAIAWPARYGKTGTRATRARAAAATAEAFSALRWARAAGAPPAAALGAALGCRLAPEGRLRDAVGALAPLLDDDALAPEVASAVAWGAAAVGIGSTRMQEAADWAERALAVAPDLESRVNALLQRGIVAVFDDRADDALRRHEEATAAARELGGPTLAAALQYEAQARFISGDLDGATTVLAEAERLARATDAQSLEAIDTTAGDIALGAGRPADALARFARSMLVAEARGDGLQVFFDLMGAAGSLAALGRDEDALFARGMASAQRDEEAAAAGFGDIIAREQLEAATARLSAEAAATAHARGRAVPRPQRVAAIARLARVATVA